MNLLFLAPRLPLPPDTGAKIRTWNILKQLAKRFKVTLVCFSFEKNDNELVVRLENIGIQVKLVSAPQPMIFEKIILVLFNSIPYSIAKYSSSKMAQALSLLDVTNEYDAVHIDHLHMVHYRGIFHDVPAVLDEHNVEYRILERCADVEKSILKRKVFREQAQKMKRFEAHAAKNFSACLTVSQDDRVTLSKITNGTVPVHVAPNGVDTELFQTTDQRLETKDQSDESLVFTGSMDWFPNDDAVIYFCNEILPLIWQRNKNIKFYVVGKGPSAKIVQMGKEDSRIIVTGLVDDVRPYMERAQVYVVPLRIGGGTRLKILEAMSMEKAVVSTTLGAEGIDYRKNFNIAIADTPQEFADRVIHLMNHPQEAKQLGVEGRKLVCGKYDWNIIGEKLAEVYKEATDGFKK